VGRYSSEHCESLVESGQDWTSDAATCGQGPTRAAAEGSLEWLGEGALQQKRALSGEVKRSKRALRGGGVRGESPERGWSQGRRGAMSDSDSQYLYVLGGDLGGPDYPPPGEPLQQVNDLWAAGVVLRTPWHAE
jgi:hypothetical protein